MRKWYLHTYPPYFSTTFLYSIMFGDEFIIYNNGWPTIKLAIKAPSSPLFNKPSFEGNIWNKPLSINPSYKWLVPNYNLFNVGSIQGLQDSKAVLVRPRSNGYAILNVNVPSGLYKIKLVHNFGITACQADFTNWLNNWGCITATSNRIQMVLTYENNTILLPGAAGYSHDGRIARSSYVTFNDAVMLVRGQKLRLWFEEDLTNINEIDNFGSISMYVLAMEQRQHEVIEAAS